MVRLWQDPKNRAELWLWFTPTNPLLLLLLQPDESSPLWGKLGHSKVGLQGTMLCTVTLVWAQINTQSPGNWFCFGFPLVNHSAALGFQIQLWEVTGWAGAAKRPLSRTAFSRCIVPLPMCSGWSVQTDAEWSIAIRRIAACFAKWDHALHSAVLN